MFSFRLKVKLAGCAVLAALFGIVMVLVIGSSAMGGGSDSDQQSGGDPAPVQVAGAGQGVTEDAVPSQYDAMFLSAQQKYCSLLPLPIFAAQIKQESDWKSGAVSAVGAGGLGQFMPQTWATYGVDADGGGADRFSPADSLAAAANYDCALMKAVADVGGDGTANMLAAYNAGPGRVEQYHGVPPISFAGGQTYNYVKKIQALAKTYTVVTGPFNPPALGSAGQATMPVVGATLTSCFCARWGTFHWGIDLAAPMLTPEYAALEGTVVRAGPATGFGLAVYIQHANGDTTVYGHMETILVKEGQHVATGEEIALLGMRGEATGPHLHFEVHQGSIYGTKIDRFLGFGIGAWLSRGADSV